MDPACLISNGFKNFGLEVHLGKCDPGDDRTKDVKSKTEAMHFPIPATEASNEDTADFDVYEGQGRYISFNVARSSNPPLD